MSAETDCPICRGRGEWRGALVCVAPYEHEPMGDDCGCPRELIRCRTCKGTGTLTSLARAVVLARGDEAPVQRRGFA